jgi:hypothetical protein
VKGRLAQIAAYRMNLHVDDPLLEPPNTIPYGSVEDQAADHTFSKFEFPAYASGADETLVSFGLRSNRRRHNVAAGGGITSDKFTGFNLA